MLRECRFGFPRDLYPETVVTENEIHMKRTSPIINNFNPIIMTCIRSNHDIKFIPTGKDGKACVFYMTDYATKSQLSTHQMLPLIAASQKKMDAANVPGDSVSRSKMLITKCLNRITTEVEISGSHVCHFLLGNSDKKTSHSFTRLNLHSSLAWVHEEMKRYDCLDEIYEDTEDDQEQTQAGYSILHGNEGLVLVNIMVDYINRGSDLTDMSLYEYSSKVYKTKLSDEERKKLSKKTRSRGRKPQPRYLFAEDHPQSETHLQIVRAEPVIPALSLLPPSEDGDKERFYTCILLLFKPFFKFTELFNGISWEDTYFNTDFKQNSTYILNIKQMHIGLKEKEETNQERSASSCEAIEEEDGEEIDFSREEINKEALLLQTQEIDLNTSQALNIIESSGWISQSKSSQELCLNMGSIASTSQQLHWKNEMKSQSQQELEFMFSNTEESVECETSNVNRTRENAILFNTTEGHENSDLETVIDNIVSEFSLNPKQETAFKLATSNIVKRIRKEDTQQIMAYVGGPGGTGKSQVIKAVVRLHDELRIRPQLWLCAYMGSAAKHIGFTTITSLAGLRNTSISKLEDKWEGVQTVLLDEVSMVGCKLLAKLSRNVTRAKHGNPNVPFGGVDMIYFGDFTQFPPVLDTPLFWNYNKDDISSSTSESSVQKELGRSIWKQLTHIVLLDQQMRITDIAYQGILNRLREGKSTTEDYMVLSSRVIGCNTSPVTLTGDPIIVPGNVLVREINNLFTNDHAKSTPVYVSKSVDVVKKNLDEKDKSTMESLPSTKTDGLLGQLPLFNGMPVFLTRNISTELGLTNGATGVVRSIPLPTNISPKTSGIISLKESLPYVVVEFNDISLNPLNGLKQSHVPVFPVHGYGVFAKENIAKGEFICEYRGEQIDKQEGMRRLADPNVKGSFVYFHDTGW
ncbi:uncharacterized protein [Clytia hemisphaerica]|uniref:uncharacterized protein n=1 Tax=Clytia hemisphaerica TaxID=252671 RepID=UPI0034D600A7